MRKVTLTFVFFLCGLVSPFGGGGGGRRRIFLLPPPPKSWAAPLLCHSAPPTEAAEGANAPVGGERRVRDGLLLRTQAEDMLSQLQTNLVGTMLTCKAAVKSMIQQQGGAIVNLGSVVGLKGNSGQSIYSASKAGLVGFSRSLAKEVARKNIRVNVVAPGHP